ncbi:MAG TPA: hypothetical protein VGJ63_12830 [Micromonosporaceae bacterium]
MRRDLRLIDHRAKDAGPARSGPLARSINDYAERTKQTVTAWNGMNDQQGGDPAKLAAALVQLASQDEPPLRRAASADAVAV